VPADGIPVADSTASASILEVDVGGCSYFEAVLYPTRLPFFTGRHEVMNACP
jgi:hypothetical protein